MLFKSNNQWNNFWKKIFSIKVEPDDRGSARGVQDGEVGERERGELQQLALWLQL